MRVENYSFGGITIDGARFERDVIILPGSVICPWWRADGHRLAPADLEAVISAGVEVLVIGCGKFGVMKVPGETLEFLKGRGIEVHSARTAKAVDIYNSLADRSKAAAALHLTC